jgi:hypothetical protein
VVDGFTHEMKYHHEKEFVEEDILSRWASAENSLASCIELEISSYWHAFL